MSFLKSIPFKVFFFLGVGVSLLLFFYSYSEQRKWEEFKQERIAKGDRFDLNDFYPDFEIPDEDNIAMHEAFIGSWEKGELKYGNLNSFFEDLKLLKKYKYNHKTKLPDISLSITDGVERTEKEAAEYILNSIGEKKGLVAPYEEALLRKYSYFPVDVEKPHITNTPQLLLFRQLANIYYMEGLAYATLGDEGGVLSSLAKLDRLTDRDDKNITLVSYLVNLSFMKTSLSLMNYSIGKGCVSSKFNGFLNKGNLPFEDFILSIEAEQASFVISLDVLSASGYESLNIGEEPWYAKVMTKTPLKGPFIAKNKRKAVCYYSRIRGLVDMNGLTQSTEGIRLFLKDLNEVRANLFFRNYDQFFAILATPAVVRQSIKAFSINTKFEMAKLALALEEYKSSAGQYPDNLVDLVPKFIAELPVDVITGDSLKYKLDQYGKPIIYSIGWNKVDEGGEIGEKVEEGDWVWRYSSD